MASTIFLRRATRHGFDRFARNPGRRRTPARADLTDTQE